MTESINSLIAAIAFIAVIRLNLVLGTEDHVQDVGFLKLKCSNLLSTSLQSFLEDEPIGQAFMESLEEVDAMSDLPSGKILGKVQDLVNEWERQLREVRHEGNGQFRQLRPFRMYTDRKRHELEVSLTYGYYFLSMRLLIENRLLEAFAELDYLKDLRTRSNGIPLAFVDDMQQKIYSAIKGACSDEDSVTKLLGPGSINTMDDVEGSYQSLSNNLGKYATREISTTSRTNLEMINGLLLTVYEIKKSLLQHAPSGQSSSSV